MNTVSAIDADGALVALTLGDGETPADLSMPPGWRFATTGEIEHEQATRAHRRMHGVAAHCTARPDPAYALAGEIAKRVPFVLTRADLDDLAATAAGPLQRPRLNGWDGWAKRTSGEVEDGLHAMINVANGHFRAGWVVEAAAYIGWGLTWLHPFNDGNGRASRAAAYAFLLAGDPLLRAAHAQRPGAVGRDRLTVPERIERRRSVYIGLLNPAHAVKAAGGAPDLAGFQRFLASLAAGQLAGHASAEDAPPCWCGR